MSQRLKFYCFGLFILLTFHEYVCSAQNVSNTTESRASNASNATNPPGIFLIKSSTVLIEIAPTTEAPLSNSTVSTVRSDTTSASPATDFVSSTTLEEKELLTTESPTTEQPVTPSTVAPLIIQNETLTPLVLLYSTPPPVLNRTYGPIPVTADSDFRKLDWYRPRILDMGSGKYSGFANDLKDFSHLKRRVVLDACRMLEYRALSGADAMKNQWRIYEIDENFFPGGEPIFVEENFNCFQEWQAPAEANYIGYLRVTMDNRTLSEAVTTFFVRDIWVVSLGDSFSSGQGNPDIQSSLFGIIPAKWLDPGCKRSAKGSYSVMLYEDLAVKYPKHGILLTFLACNGASLRSGILGSQSGRRAQIRVLEELISNAREDCSVDCENSLKRCPCKRKPDLVLIGIGGNDLEYSRVVKSILMGRPWPELQATRGRLWKMEERLQRMNEKVRKLGVDPGSIHYVEYFDLLRNDDGVLDANCGGVGLGTTWDFFLADTLIRKPINDLIGKTCDKFGWMKVDGIDEEFSSHGVCATDSFIRLLPDSLVLQGDWNGAFHPNFKGQRAVANILWQRYAEQYFERIFS